MNFKIKETVMFMRSENMYLLSEIFWFHSFECFVLPKKAFLRQANGIVCLMRACLSVSPC